MQVTRSNPEIKVVMDAAQVSSTQHVSSPFTSLIYEYDAHSLARCTFSSGSASADEMLRGEGRLRI